MPWGLWGGGQQPPPQPPAAGYGAPPQTPVLAAVGDALHVLDGTCARAGYPRPYADRQRICDDIASVCEYFPGLKPVQAPLLNWPHPLLALVGTIPISSGGCRYNIPVSIFVLPAYPRHHAPAQPPVLALVTPTAQMTLRPGHPRLDTAGRGQCVLAALTHWHPVQSSLLGVASEMAAEFSQEPPCYALPPGAVAPGGLGGASGGGYAVPATAVAMAYPAGGGAHAAPQATVVQPLPALPPAPVACGGAGGARIESGGGGSGAALPAQQLSHAAAHKPVDLAEELAAGRRAFLADQLRARAARLQAEHERSAAALRAQRQALQQRAAAIVAADAACTRERAALERATLARSEARGSLEEWAATHGVFLEKLRANAMGGGDAAPVGAADERAGGADGGVAGDEGSAALDRLLAPADARGAALLAALAEERALRDSLGMVSALQADGHIEPTLFLKWTRKLSRELFFAQAARMELGGGGSAAAAR